LVGAFGLPIPVYKITLAGDNAVGKTSLCDRFMGKAFSADYTMTLGTNIAYKTVRIEGEKVKFQVWDTGGQPHFESVRSAYYKGSLGVLLVFDITRFDTFESIPNWGTEFWKNTGRGKVPAVLLGNKIDLRATYPKATGFEKGELLASELSKTSQEIGFEIPYVETSAKSGANVDRAFLLLAKNIKTYTQMHLVPKKQLNTRRENAMKSLLA